MGRKKNAKSRSNAPNFGAALAKAREDADHIFKQANEESMNMDAEIQAAAENLKNNNTKNDNDDDPRSKAAAWAWYQRNSNGNNNSSPENVRNRALVVLKRSSRFKAEALRINGSCTAEDTLANSSSSWDPSRSLFDSYELLSVAKELDRALKEAPVAQKQKQKKSMAIETGPPPPPDNAKLSSSKSLDSKSSLKRLSKFIPGPVLCLSEDDIASSSPKRKSELGGPKSASVKASGGSSSKLGGKLSKAIQLFTYTPPSLEAEDPQQQYLHQHFHHHHHLHHHVVDEISL